MADQQMDTKRVIKFRGKRKDDTVHNGSWVYGHYFTAPLTDENSGLPPETGWFFLSGGERRHCIEQDGVVFTVDSETVRQYIGRKDKNDVEIYEGDVVSFKSFEDHDLPERIGVVDFSNASFFIKRDFSSHYRWTDYEIEVIRDKYE